MTVRTCTSFALALAAIATAGCATPLDPDKPLYDGARYRTGSNIPVQKGDMHGSEQTYKADDVPLYRPQVQRTGGPAPTGP